MAKLNEFRRELQTIYDRGVQLGDMVIVSNERFLKLIKMFDDEMDVQLNRKDFNEEALLARLKSAVSDGGPSVVEAAPSPDENENEVEDNYETPQSGIEPDNSDDESEFDDDVPSGGYDDSYKTTEADIGDDFGDLDGTDESSDEPVYNSDEDSDEFEDSSAAFDSDSAAVADSLTDGAPLGDDENDIDDDDYDETLADDDEDLDDDDYDEELANDDEEDDPEDSDGDLNDPESEDDSLADPDSSDDDNPISDLDSDIINNNGADTDNFSARDATLNNMTDGFNGLGQFSDASQSFNPAEALSNGASEGDNQPTPPESQQSVVSEASNQSDGSDGAHRFDVPEDNNNGTH